MRGSSWKSLASLVNLNGLMSSSPFEDMVELQWLSLAMSMPT